MEKIVHCFFIILCARDRKERWECVRARVRECVHACVCVHACACVYSRLVDTEADS